MRIAVVHSTVYRYSAAVYLEPHIIRLRPRHDASQRLAVRLAIAPTPPAAPSAWTRMAISWWARGLVQPPELTVESAFAVETLRNNPFDYLLTPRDTELPWSTRVPRAPLAPYRREPTGAAREFAAAVAAEGGWQTIAFLAALNPAECSRTW